MNFEKLKEKIRKREKKILDNVQKDYPPGVIPVTINSVKDLVMTNDPHKSLEEARMNLAVEEYLMEECNRLPSRLPIVIELHINNADGQDAKAEQVTAQKIIENHFDHYFFMRMLKKRTEMKLWRRKLFIGFIFLAICLALSSFLSNSAIIKIPANLHFLTESLTIIGWVAIWEPVTYFLYGWTEGGEDFFNAVKLKNAKVKLI